MSRGQIVRKPLTVRERSRRTLDQRVAIRFPRLFDAYARLMVGRLPPTSRVRQAALWRGTRHGIEAFNRRDIDAALVYFHPDFEYHPPREFVEEAGLAQAGFAGPRTVFEGSHGLYKAFAPSKTPDFSKLLDGLGPRWVMETLAFKPYASGTMTQPGVDCALRLAASGVKADEVVAITCKVGEGTVHRLWEPLSENLPA